MNTDTSDSVDGSASTLSFLGAAQTVTGSRYLIESGGRKVLVDCGLFQGYKVLRERNRRAFPVSPASIDALVLTHAHLDHSGYIPALVRDGFTGPIYATSGTAELCSVLLPDSGHLFEEEASFAKRRGSSRHHDPQPIYTVANAMRSLDSFRTRPFDDAIDLGNAIRATFIPAGHILGAAQIHFSLGSTSIHFTGDLGRLHDPLMHPPRPLEPVDILVSESTYGNRLHPDAHPGTELGAAIRRVARRGGVILIPAFAVARAESLLLHISRLRARREIPEIPVFLNSPMAVSVSQMYQRHRDEHRVSSTEFADMYGLAQLVNSVDESKLLNLRGGPMIIISASGMLTGGRVLHHVAAYGSDPKNAIILTGYQAGGTRGAALARGEDHLRIYGRDIPIRAEVIEIESLSAHADSNELIEWMGNTPRAPKMTYITHGEPDAAEALRLRIKHELGRNARVPDDRESIDLTHPE